MYGLEFLGLLCYPCLEIPDVLNASDVAVGYLIVKGDGYIEKRGLEVLVLFLQALDQSLSLDVLLLQLSILSINILQLILKSKIQQEFLCLAADSASALLLGPF